LASLKQGSKLNSRDRISFNLAEFTKKLHRILNFLKTLAFVKLGSSEDKPESRLSELSPQTLMGLIIQTRKNRPFCSNEGYLRFQKANPALFPQREVKNGLYKLQLL
jgi:hypothetical protein